jgi:hypothetical protein
VSAVDWAPVTSLQLDPDSPWPGLASYDESSRDFFGGRAAESEELQRRILGEPVTVVFGKSGLGKTSLLKAGVFPRLRERGLLPVLVRLQFQPGVPPLIEQARRVMFDEMRAYEIEHPALAEGETLWEYLHRAGKDFWTKQNRLVRPVFVFDQFEEVFTLGRAVPMEVGRFREDLADLAENRLPSTLAHRLENNPASDLGLDVQAMPYKIVLALREDFLADLEEWRRDMPSLRRNRMRLLPMGSAQALEAVWNERTKHLMSEAHARQIVAFLSSADAVDDEFANGATIEPALLSLFCHGVNEHRKRGGKAQFDDELIEGGKGTIVADFYKESVGDQPERVRRFIEEELITEHGYRNSYAVDSALARGAITTTELDTLINRHLLRHEHHLGTERVELTHDLLTRAVADERDARRIVERTAHERRQRRKYALIAVACLFAAVGGLVLAGIAWQARHEAESRELAALAASSQNADPELAVMLALRGLRQFETPQARSALLNAAQYAWPSATLDWKALGGDASAVAMSPDGTRLIVLADGKTISLWDVTARTPKGVWKNEIDFHDSASIAFSPDGSLIAIGRRHSIDLVNPATGKVRKQLLPNEDEEKRRVAFSVDGQWLAASVSAKHLQLWNHEAERPTARDVEGPIDFGFVVLAGGTRIIGVTEDDQLKAYSLESQDDGRHWKTTPLTFPQCVKPQSVSPGTRYLSETWRARTCVATASDGRSYRQEERTIEDIVWTTSGGAFAQLLAPEGPAHDLVVGRVAPGEWLENRIKGTHPHEGNDRTQLISLSDDGTRAALIDVVTVEGAERKIVRIYSLGSHKLMMTPLTKGQFELSSDGMWMSTVTSREHEPGVTIAISPIDEMFSGRDVPPTQTLIPLEKKPEAFYLTRTSVVVVQATDPTTSTVFDAATGKRRFDVQAGRAMPLGASGDLLLVRSVAERPWRLLRTRDGSLLTEWQTIDGVAVASGAEAIAVVDAVASTSSSLTATAYAVRGESLVRIGNFRGLPNEPGLSRFARLSADGRSLAFGRTVRRIDEEVSNASSASSQRGREERRVDVSPLGGYEVRETPGEVLVMRRNNQEVLRRFKLESVRQRFSIDDRWLALWTRSQLQMLDLGRGEIAFDISVDGPATNRAPTTIENVAFAGTRIARVTLNLSETFIPLESSLLQRFASWLVPRDLTREQECLLGLGGRECRNTAVPAALGTPHQDEQTNGTQSTVAGASPP